MKTISKKTFAAMLESLEVGFPFLSRDAGERKRRANLYFSVSEHYREETIAKVFRAIAEDWREDNFPTPGRLVGLIEAELSKQRQEQAWPKPIAPRSPHDCRENLTMKVTTAWKILSDLNPYEARHVFCPGRPHPVCPACGAKQEPFENPLILQLVGQYPGECKDWNHFHKGYLLCNKCENLKTAKQMRERQAQVRGGSSEPIEVRIP